MGKWFAKFLAANDYDIIICDRNKSAAQRLTREEQFQFMDNEIDAVKLSRLIILATPTQTTKAILNRIGPHISQTSLLVEISSVKEPLIRTIQSLAKHGVRILSIHPMFGPGAKNLAGRSIIVAQQPRRNQVATSLLLAFRKKGARIIPSNLENHDRIVAATLALPHFMNFAFVATLKKSGLTPNEVRKFAGTTLKLQLTVAEALYHEKLHNEASILADNKYSAELLKTFTEQANTIRNAIRKGSSAELTHRLQSGAAYVRKDNSFRAAYDEFSAAVEALKAD